MWKIPRPLPLNQGAEGACVGFGWSGQLSVGPIFNKTNNAYAKDYYTWARAIDKLAGNVFAEGASVLAGAKVAKNRGLISGYRWAFGINDVIDTIIAKGPVVLGIPWYDSMYGTLNDGRIEVNGPQVGGHCILAVGYYPNHLAWGGNWIALLNSWGRTYGVNGIGWVRDSDLSMLLQNDGEAVIADEIDPHEPKGRIGRAMDSVKSVFRND